MKKNNIISVLIMVLTLQFSDAKNTEIVYLSGTGLNDTKTWEFFCSDGMKSGQWSTIEVPSQWELQGFGEYTYGRFYLDKEAKPSSETGTYRYQFEASSKWENKEIEIVFEGVMTDTEVKINNRLVGDIHQGGFYRFSYNISDKLIFGKKNTLEVKVWKESSNNSVNRAERRADWWLFGGIYRPVYLRILPEKHIERIAVDAKADGSLTTRVHFNHLESGYKLSTSVISLKQGELMGRKVQSLQTDEVQTLNTKWEGIKPWDPENPHLYVLKLELLNPQNKIEHIHEERIGFRTIEFRPQDGIYVNGVKTIMKGINRHTFHPDGGRTTNRAISLQDALLIKEMNMNAVRSHYPPDKHFLEMCDSIGIFYLNELAGWHDAYDTQVGRKLLKGMIDRDVNHPSIFMWCNGNEGGWNKNLDPLFAVYDLQKRHVIHPWADFNGIDTHHYPAYQTGPARLANGYKVFMPTEFLHGRYDRGHGAGLEDYWEQYSNNPMFAGGFLWTYVDEAVRRTDKNGELDAAGFQGPDGIVGPYREKEGSFFTVRDIWSPIQFENLLITPNFDRKILITNKFQFTRLSTCTMKYRLYTVSSPLQHADQILIAEGKVSLPDIAPGETGRATIHLPDYFLEADILELEAFDQFGRSVANRTWPIRLASAYFNKQRANLASNHTAKASQTEALATLSNQNTSITFNRKNGQIEAINQSGQLIPLNNGPVSVGMKMELTHSYVRMDDKDALFVAKYRGAVDSIVWRMTSEGLLGMDVVMLNNERGRGFEGRFFDEKIYHLGFTFSFPETEVAGMQWMGRGPYRVWKNRIRGKNYGLWQKNYNNTITGESFESHQYLEFKGYHANLYWATIESRIAPFTVYSETDGVYLRVFTPEEPTTRLENSMHPFPEGDISFLLEIPAMRSFKPISEHGPRSQPSTIRIKSGDEGVRMKLWFDFRKANHS